jgi:hypothetical protein
MYSEVPYSAGTDTDMYLYIHTPSLAPKLFGLHGRSYGFPIILYRPISTEYCRIPDPCSRGHELANMISHPT